MLQLLILFIFIHTHTFAIQLFPSGISVNFESPLKANRKSILLQDEEAREEKSLKTDRFIRVINSIPELPKNTYLALVFYNQKNKVVGHQKIMPSEKPSVDKIFFIDRNSNKKFQGILDIYSVPKKAISFSLAFVNKRGKVIQQNFTHPDFNENNQITIEQLYDFSTKKNIMLQYEVNGTYKSPEIKLAAFHFV